MWTVDQYKRDLLIGDEALTEVRQLNVLVSIPNV